jgi:hypothetical protein
LFLGARLSKFVPTGLIASGDASTGVVGVTDGVHAATFKFDGFNGTVNFLVDLNPHGQHPDVDAILLKNVALANLHADDFVLPTH